jgi:uncharacterized membrane protein YjfL (UPF0719 family)
MEWEYLKANGVQLMVNLAYAFFALVIGIIVFRFIDKYLFREIDFIDEIKKGNVAAAVFASALLLFVAFIVGFSVS